MGNPPAPPATFFAVLDYDSRIVEIATETGKILRTVVDLGIAPEYIQSLDVDSERSTLYFGIGLKGPLYRMRLPDGHPERIGDGEGVTVSPDGRRLAFARTRDLVVLHLLEGREDIFPGFIGDLGGRPVTWQGDTLAVEIDGADVTSVVLLDTKTRQTTELQPSTGDARNYTPHAPWFRPSDGLLAVVCCTRGEIDPNEPPPPAELVLHDPTTGEERDRTRLRLPGGGFDYDASRTYQLLSSEDAVHWRSDRETKRIPQSDGARLAVW